MERSKNAQSTANVLGFELTASQSADVSRAPLEQVDRALVAVARNLAAARAALDELRETAPLAARSPVSVMPILLNIPQVCRLLGYKKTKVYELMKNGLLPYVVEANTGHRRIEYRAVEQFVKRLRGERSERRAS